MPTIMRLSSVPTPLVGVAERSTPLVGVAKRPTPLAGVARQIAALALVPALAFAQPAQPAQPTGGSMLIKNATVLTVTNGTLQNTDILVRNGKIAQVGQNLAAPAGAQVV